MKKIIISALLLCVICCVGVYVFMQGSYPEPLRKVLAPKSDITEEMTRQNIDGNDVEIVVDPTIVDRLSEADMNEVLNEGLGTIHSFVQIVSAETLEKEDVSALQGSAAYIYTTDGKLVGLTLPDDLSTIDANAIMDIIIDHDLSYGDVVNIMRGEWATEIEDSGEEVETNKNPGQHAYVIDEKLSQSGEGKA